jgi:LPS-assembly lipoprotein
MRRRALLLVLPLALTACGFHLRGVGDTTPFPFHTLRVVTSAGGVGDVVQRQLSLQPNVELVQQDPADAVLTVEPERMDKQILTIDRSGRVSEYQLIYRARFRLEVGKHEWIYPTVLTLHRDYAFDQNNPLGTEAEEQLLVRDMRLDATQQIIRRLSAAKEPAFAPAVTPTDAPKPVAP